MTATLNKQGEIVLQSKAVKKLGFKNGDLFVLSHDPLGRVILQKRAAKRRAKEYLTPPPLPASTRARLYARPDPLQDKLEAEAILISRRALAGRKLEDL